VLVEPAAGAVVEVACAVPVLGGSATVTVFVPLSS
jgi:hypothetical protein